MSRSDAKDEIFLSIACELGQLGTCNRGKVGAVITHSGRCVSWGYNGAPPGLPHCDEVNHGLSLGPWFDNKGEDERVLALERAVAISGCRNATHAEANAIAFAARQGISTEGGTLYVERSPCDICARLLIAAGIVRVVFSESYRDTQPIELLQQAGVEVTHAPR